MSLKEAFEQSSFLTVAILAAIVWTVFSAARVLGQFDYWNPEPFGMTPGAGIVGVLVMGIGVVLAVALLGAFEHDEPAPQSWPPEDA
ncbi:hypothetical protein [Halolamina sediminis]|jgi:hypothetical protein|uniref:hypothetical protein n=1 Tax=Halolamina sediminis TaxID=1480675 RepID=UPI0006B67F6B|nr:hypothetical protein [Halolamina sediminis]